MITIITITFITDRICMAMTYTHIDRITITIMSINCRIIINIININMNIFILTNFNKLIYY